MKSAGIHTMHQPMNSPPCEIDRPAPCLGEHNAHIYQEMLGFSDSEIADMIAEGIITTAESCTSAQTR